jgi:hypothetical protein
MDQDSIFMPSKKAVQSEAVVSPASALAPAPAKVVRKRATTKVTEAGETATVSTAKRPTGTRKKAAVAADTTSVAAVTHRHKKLDAVAETAPSAGVAVPVAAYEPSHDEVSNLAYSYYVARGYQPGDQGADWFRAVNELKQRHLAALLSDDAK